jgi:hypothetical protein
MATMTAANPSTVRLRETVTHLVLVAGAANVPRIQASQVHVSYSASGPKGRFVSVPLAGSTAGGNAIQGYIGPLRGTAIPAHSSEKLTLRISLDRDIRVSTRRPVVDFHGFLDETNPASGSNAAIADSNASPVVVLAAAPSSHTLRDSLIAVGVVALLLASALLALWRRRRTRPQTLD